jgi:tetratricopeptide (TPR) repeat protein
VLEAAIAANANDATAHFLLGTLLFSKDLTDAGMAHWSEAKRLAPHLPVVDADLGDAWLRLKGDAQRALAAYHEGLRDDAENIEVYAGLDAALSLTGAAAGERADALAQFPGADAPGSKMPANLVYQLALTRAEAGRFEQALPLFAGRFFPSEEGGVTSAEVQFEIRLMQAEAWASAGDCAQAGAFVAAELSEMSREPRSARQYFKMAGVARGCGRTKEAEELMHRAAALAGQANVVWAIRAEKSLGALDAEEADRRVANALASAESIPDTDAVSGTWWYEVGLLQAWLHRTGQDGGEAKTSLEKALILPDSHMSHHLAREALAEMDLGR